MPKHRRGFRNSHGVRINIGTREPIVGGMLTGPRPDGYTDEMLSRDMRAARQAMMAERGTSIRQARKDIKDHIDHVHNQRARV